MTSKTASAAISAPRPLEGIARTMMAMARNAEGGDVHVVNEEEKRAVSKLEKMGLVKVRRTTTKLAGMTEWYYSLAPSAV